MPPPPPQAGALSITVSHNCGPFSSTSVRYSLSQVLLSAYSVDVGEKVDGRELKTAPMQVKNTTFLSRSFVTMFAVVLLGVVFISSPTYAGNEKDSTWTHGGSTMGLIWGNDRRLAIGVAPTSNYVVNAIKFQLGTTYNADTVIGIYNADSNFVPYGNALTLETVHMTAADTLTEKTITFTDGPAFVSGSHYVFMLSAPSLYSCDVNNPSTCDALYAFLVSPVTDVHNYYSDNNGTWSAYNYNGSTTSLAQYTIYGGQPGFTIDLPVQGSQNDLPIQVSGRCVTNGSLIESTSTVNFISQNTFPCSTTCQSGIWSCTYTDLPEGNYDTIASSTDGIATDFWQLVKGAGTNTGKSLLWIVHPTDDGNHLFLVYPSNHRQFRFRYTNVGLNANFQLWQSTSTFAQTEQGAYEKLITNSTTHTLDPTNTQFFDQYLSISTSTVNYFRSVLLIGGNPVAYLPFIVTGDVTASSTADLPTAIKISNDYFNTKCPIKFMLDWDPCYQVGVYITDVVDSMSNEGKSMYTKISAIKPYRYAFQTYEAFNSILSTTTSTTPPQLTINFGYGSTTVLAPDPLQSVPTHFWTQLRPYEDVVINLMFFGVLIGLFI